MISDESELIHINQEISDLEKQISNEKQSSKRLEDSSLVLARRLQAEENEASRRFRRSRKEDPSLVLARRLQEEENEVYRRPSYSYLNSLIKYDCYLDESRIKGSITKPSYNLVNNAGNGNCGYFSILCGLKHSPYKNQYLLRLNELLKTDFKSWDETNCHKDHDLVKKIKLVLLEIGLDTDNDNDICRQVRREKGLRTDLINSLTPRRMAPFMNTMTCRLMAFAFGVNVITQCKANYTGSGWEGADSSGNFPLINMSSGIDLQMAPYSLTESDTIWILNDPRGVHYQFINWDNA